MQHVAPLATSGVAYTYRASLRIERALANRQRTAVWLEGLAEVAAAVGQPEQAAWLFGAASGVPGGDTDRSAAPSLAARRERVAANARQTLDEAEWAVVFATGRAMTMEEAVAAAREERR